MSENELFPKKDEIASIELFPSWPTANIAGYSHDGDTYCVECAEEHDDIDTEKYRKNPEKVAYGGTILTNSEWDIEPHCGNVECGKRLDVRNLKRR